MVWGWGGESHLLAIMASLHSITDMGTRGGDASGGLVVGPALPVVRLLPGQRVAAGEGERRDRLLEERSQMVKRIWQTVLRWLTRLGPRLLCIAMLLTGISPRGFGLG
jgi:hypothetical protein